MTNLFRAAALALLPALLVTTGAHHRPRHRAAPTAAQFTAALASAIHADVGASVYDPAIGKVVWAFGDATQVNGVNQVSFCCWPHSELGLQAPGAASFYIRPGPYGPKDVNGHTWQQVPNWADGSYFWASGILLDGPSIWLVGNRITGLPAAAPIRRALPARRFAAAGGSVGDVAVARFNASTLAFEGVTDLGYAGEVWGSSVPDPQGGTWVTGTRPAAGGKQGDVAFVPAGGWPYPASWAITGGAVPPALNPGTVISPAADGAGFRAFTKTGDRYGSTTIEELSAPAMDAQWAATGKTWPACSAGGDCATYSVELHPGEGEPAGEELATFAVNDAAQYGLVFTVVTL